LKLDSIEKVFSLAIKYPELKKCRDSIANTIESFRDCFNSGNKILICGNGGSASDAEHIVGELMKNFRIKRRLSLPLKEKIKQYFDDASDYVFENIQMGLPTLSLMGETALISALCNDSQPDLVFANQIMAHGKENDILLAISTSGDSNNIINACKMAKVKGMKAIGLTGKHGGELNNCTDILIKAPAEETYLVQEYHLSIYHTICACVENEIYGE
jgi:D-sedoheptulose 7-phosphate isomerase